MLRAAGGGAERTGGHQQGQDAGEGQQDAKADKRAAEVSGGQSVGLSLAPCSVS